MSGTSTRPRVGRWLLGAVVLLVAVSWFNDPWYERTEQEKDYDWDRPRVIVLAVEGVADRATILHDATGVDQTVRPAPTVLPWRSRPFKVARGQRVTLTASRPGRATLEVSIIQDDRVRATDSSSGPGAVGVSWVVT